MNELHHIRVYRFPVILSEESQALLESDLRAASTYYRALVVTVNEELSRRDDTYRDAEPGQWAEWEEAASAARRWPSRPLGELPRFPRHKSTRLRDITRVIGTEKKRLDELYRAAGISWSTRNSIVAAVKQSVDQKAKSKRGQSLLQPRTFLQENRTWRSVGGQNPSQGDVPVTVPRQAGLSVDLQAVGWQDWTMGHSRAGKVRYTGSCRVYRPVPAGATVSDVELSVGDHPTRRRTYLHVTVKLRGEAPVAPAGGLVVGYDAGWAADGDRMIAGALSTGHIFDVTAVDEAVASASAVMSTHGPVDPDAPVPREVLEARATVENAISARDACYQRTLRELRSLGYSVLAIEDTSAISRIRAQGGRVSRRQASLASPGRLAAIARDQGWSVVEVNPAYTSRTCSECGCCEPGARDGRSYVCPACGSAVHADVNAAVNIERLGAEQNGAPTRIEWKVPASRYISVRTYDVEHVVRLRATRKERAARKALDKAAYLQAS